MTREQIIKALSGSIDSMITNKRTMIHISGPMAEEVLAYLQEHEAAGPKMGHWIFDSTDYEAWTHTCSECEKRMTTAFGMYANFCWNCGAKMDGQAGR